MKPHEIEEMSMRIIDEELKKQSILLPEAYAPVVKRVIHTTADFDYAVNLFFSDDAVRKIQEALRPETVIITDTNMALSGISKPALAELSMRAECYMADAGITKAAKEQQVTRASLCVKEAFRRHAQPGFVTGNAPTALYAIAEEITMGARPAFVIAVPVGFVNVVSSKEEIIRLCKENSIPVIAARGRKGGSNVAAAIVNALCYQKLGRIDPKNRY